MSPEKNTRWRGADTTQLVHSDLLVSKTPRRLQCWHGTLVNVKPLASIVCSAHHVSSTTLVACSDSKNPYHTSE